jgi:hypothetical protein
MPDSEARRPARPTPASTRRELEKLERDLDPTTPTRMEAHLERYRRFAWLMDESIKLPVVPFRIGLDSIVGLIPGVGDLVLGTMGTYALFVAWRLGAPGPVLARMLGNLGIDTLFGSIPLIGDLFDAGFKANTRNRRVLEAWLAEPRRTAARSRWIFVVALVALVLLVGASLWLAWTILSLLLTWLRTGSGPA